MITPNCLSYNPNFYANPNSPKLNFRQSDFFVRIRGYGKNSQWAKQAITTADESCNYIRNNWSIENILKKITLGIKAANSVLQNIAKREHTGILRTPREGWIYGSAWNGYYLETAYHQGRYSIYSKRLDSVQETHLQNPFDDIELSIPRHAKSGKKYILHASPKFIHNAFKHLDTSFKEYNKKFIKNEVTQENLNELNSLIAEIRWILAHSTPWERGSDAIANVLMRAMYKAAGVKSFPLKKDISLDLEAYCTELKDYKKLFPSYFVKPPEIVD